MSLTPIWTRSPSPPSAARSRRESKRKRWSSGWRRRSARVRVSVESHVATDDEWKLLWSILQIQVESNGMVGPNRSRPTRDRICALLMENASYSDDLPPNEIPNPDPETCASDLVAVQDLLLGGRVREEASCDS